LALDNEPVSIAYAGAVAKRRVQYRRLARSAFRRAFTGVRFATMEADKAVKRADCPRNIASTPPIFGGGGSITTRAAQGHPFAFGMQLPGSNTTAEGAMRPRAFEMEGPCHVKQDVQAVRHGHPHSFRDGAREVHLERLVRSPFGRTSQAGLNQW